MILVSDFFILQTHPDPDYGRDHPSAGGVPSLRGGVGKKTI
jgi:hypothetical protein